MNGYFYILVQCVINPQPNATDIVYFLSLKNNIWIPLTFEAVLLEIINVFLSEDQKNAHQNER